MNSNSPVIFRTLLIYLVCVPLAITIGYLLANPFDKSTFIYAALFGLLLAFPLLVKWHQILLLFSWHTGIAIFFLNSRPDLWLAIVPLSLGISILERSMSSRMHFISAPQIVRPLIVLVAVVLFTAQMTGGLGLRSMGSSVYGGKKYIFFFIIPVDFLEIFYL